MSFVSASRPKWFTLALASAALGVASLGSAGAAQASQPCRGNNILGNGSSLQGDAQQLGWGPGFNRTTTVIGPCPTSPTVTYTKSSSGTGLGLWNADGRTTPVSATNGFIGTDDPPTTGTGSQRANMERSIASGGTGSTVVQIPVAQSSIAIVANLPTNCSFGSNGITAANLETAFRGVTRPTWTTLGATGTGCGVSPTRVVRADVSGTTYQFKHYLSTVFSSRFCTGAPANRSWLELQDPTLNNSWCNDAGNLQASLGGGTSGSGSGGGDEVKTVSNTPNSIGYAGLADASNPANDPRTSISQIKVKGAGQLAFSSASLSGDSNCTNTNTAYTNNGSSTLPTPDGDWTKVYYTAPASTYPICTLTYDLALEDYGPLFGSTGTPTTGQKVGQTVFDYGTYAISTAGETAVSGRGYAKLPTPVKTQSTAGLALIRVIP